MQQSFGVYEMQKEQKNQRETYHQVPNNHDQHEDQDAKRLSSNLHTIPHGLDPFTTQDPKYD